MGWGGGGVPIPTESRGAPMVGESFSPLEGGAYGESRDYGDMRALWRHARETESVGVLERQSHPGLYS